MYVCICIHVVSCYFLQPYTDIMSMRYIYKVPWLLSNAEGSVVISYQYHVIQCTSVCSVPQLLLHIYMYMYVAPSVLKYAYTFLVSPITLKSTSLCIQACIHMHMYTSHGELRMFSTAKRCSLHYHHTHNAVNVHLYMYDVQFFVHTNVHVFEWCTVWGAWHKTYGVHL